MIHYRPMESSDAEAVSEFCIRIFDEFVASSCKPEGRETFAGDSAPDNFVKHAEENHVILAFDEERLIGVVNMKKDGYLKLLFVEGDVQGKGLGKKLLSLAIEGATAEGHRPELIEVKSAVNSVPFYEKLGFKPEGEVEEKKGIRYRTMKLDLSF